MVKIVNREPVPAGPEASVPEAAAVQSAVAEAGIALDALKRGEGGIILSVVAEPAMKLHLMELGFVPGSPITFLMSTPFGDPNIYALRGTSIALRKSEAKCIRVRT